LGCYEVNREIETVEVLESIVRSETITEKDWWKLLWEEFLIPRHPRRINNQKRPAPFLFSNNSKVQPKVKIKYTNNPHTPADEHTKICRNSFNCTPNYFSN
jgi:hypothetical protein